MRRLLALSGLLLGSVSGVSLAHADCGSMTIASMNWQSAEVISNLDKIILNEGYGCSAEITVGDTVPTITSMAEKGEPDIAPEAWIDLLPDVVKKGTDEGRIIKVGSPLPDGGVQGWWIPKYLADAHPDIKTIGDAL
ncbi:glycine betaine ABC transporter substrate-binding protein, partial [Rhizobium sp. Leaf386]|uniref:glycine betaine ABC transporter substrate-binding protein n=1 Tax=Rhizobium sp. Leaf386 TaxID=1736359 RepID=UPI00244EA2A2